MAKEEVSCKEHRLVEEDVCVSRRCWCIFWDGPSFFSCAISEIVNIAVMAIMEVIRSQFLSCSEHGKRGEQTEEKLHK